VRLLAHKVEQQGKNKPYKREFPKPQNRNQPFNKGSSNPPLRASTLDFPNPQRTQAPQKAFTPPDRPNPSPMNP